jgi:predicted  nucleic acid-binding Zn-ribbon protein
MPKIEDQNRFKQQIVQLQKKLKNKEWACKKTSEGIRVLYRQLEKKNQDPLKTHEKLEKVADTRMKILNDFQEEVSEYEEDIQNLKKEVNALQTQQGRPPKYELG